MRGNLLNINCLIWKFASVSLRGSLREEVIIQYLIIAGSMEIKEKEDLAESNYDDLTVWGTSKSKIFLMRKEDCPNCSPVHLPLFMLFWALWQPHCSKRLPLIYTSFIKVWTRCEGLPLLCLHSFLIENTVLCTIKSWGFFFQHTKTEARKWWKLKLIAVQVETISLCISAMGSYASPQHMD